jgi:hypothetical protein
MARSPLCRKCVFYARLGCWTSKTATCLAAGAALLLLSCGLQSGCHSEQRDIQPSIEFNKIPPAAEGGRERVDTIADRVIGARRVSGL